MHIKNKERQIIFTDEELDPHDGSDVLSGEIMSKLLSVMVYPDNEEKQQLFMTGLAAKNLKERLSKEEKELFLKTEPDLLYLLYEKEDESKDAYSKCTESRMKKDTGKLYVRGLAAGRILIHMILSHGCLEKAYMFYRENCSHWGQPMPPSISVLEKIWKEYCSISPLWAAYIVCMESPSHIKKSMVTVEVIGLAIFLQIASFFRNQLVEVKISSTGTYLIKDPVELWTFLMSSNLPIPPAKGVSHLKMV